MMSSLRNTHSSERRWLRILIYGAFVFVLLWKHYPMSLQSDDKVVAEMIAGQSLWERFSFLYETNGRIFTDFFASVFIKNPIWIWKVFDTAIVFSMTLAIVYLFTDRSVKSVAGVCMLVLLYPTDYLESAGYISTSANYLYPVFGLLLVLIPLIMYYRNQKVPFYMFLFAAAGLLYCSNHDQSAVVQSVGLGLSLIYFLLYDKRKPLVRYTGVMFFLSCLSYLYMFLLPGHRYRMQNTVEMEYWFPEYADWSFIKKVYHGYTSTVSNLMFGKVNLFLLFVLVLALVGLTALKVRDKVIAGIPLGVVLLSGIMGERYFIEYPSYANKMPELLTAYSHRLFFIPLVLSILVVACILYSLCTLIPGKDRRYRMCLLMILASGSRLMMGFSATIYASSYRTFTLFLFVLIAEILLLLTELWERKAYICYWIGYGGITAMLLQAI